MTNRMLIYECLAFPAHCWLHVAAWLVGARFECGPVEDDRKHYDE